MQACVKSLILIVLFLFCGQWTTAATAARIILKDGTVEHSDKVWESGGYVHFILKGTRDVEIRYAKQIVERIEYQDAKGATAPTSSVTPPMQSGNASAAQAPAQKPHAVKEHPPVAAVVPNQLAEDKIVKETKGILFYDPRRPQRYWSSRLSRHTTLEGALDALSRQYGRPVQWIETHMGEENDLGSIHSKLIQQKERELAGVQDSNATQSEKQLDAGKPPQSSGEARPADLAGPAAKPTLDTANAVHAAESGVAFYDPRRSEKYWTGKSGHYQTLKDAINALARQYHVSAEWIGAHMGDTNDLEQIHRNIQKSLAEP